MKKYIILCLSLFILFLLPLTKTVDAAPKTHSKTGLVAIYNPNGGGLLASIALTSHTYLDNRDLIAFPTFKGISLFPQAHTKKFSFTQCGGIMDVVSSKVGNQTASLVVDPGPHWGDASYTVTYMKSSSAIIASIGTQTIETKVQFYPQTCIGGGSVTDTFSYNNY